MLLSRLIGVFAGRTCQFVGLCHAVAQFYVTAILSSMLIIELGEEGVGRFAGSQLVCPHFVVPCLFVPEEECDF